MTVKAFMHDESAIVMAARNPGEKPEGFVICGKTITHAIYQLNRHKVEKYFGVLASAGDSAIAKDFDIRRAEEINIDGATYTLVPLRAPLSLDALLGYYGNPPKPDLATTDENLCRAGHSASLRNIVERFCDQPDALNAFIRLKNAEHEPIRDWRSAEEKRDQSGGGQLPPR